MLAALRLLLVLGLVGCDGGEAVMRFFGWVGCYLQCFFPVGVCAWVGQKAPLSLPQNSAD